MTNQEALIKLKSYLVLAGGMASDDLIPLGMAIVALEKQSALQEELKAMKKKAYNFNNSDYANGYISAISTIEGFWAGENE